MDDLTEAQEDFVARWFFGSPIIVLALLLVAVVLTRPRGERQWLRIVLGLVIGGALPAVPLLTAMVGLFPAPSPGDTTVVDHLRLAGEEELLKFAAAVLLCLPLGGRSVVMAGVIGASVATGFTITENARFFMTAPTFRVLEAIVVNRTFVPVHVVLTCAACLVAAAGWTSRGRGWWAYGGAALVGTTVLHAGENLRLGLRASWLDVVVQASFVVAALGLVGAGALHRHRSARVAHSNELGR